MKKYTEYYPVQENQRYMVKSDIKKKNSQISKIKILLYFDDEGPRDTPSEQESNSVPILHSDYGLHSWKDPDDPKQVHIDLQQVGTNDDDKEETYTIAEGEIDHSLEYIAKSVIDHLIDNYQWYSGLYKGMFQDGLIDKKELDFEE